MWTSSQKNGKETDELRDRALEPYLKNFGRDR